MLRRVLKVPAEDERKSSHGDCIVKAHWQEGILFEVVEALTCAGTVH